MNSGQAVRIMTGAPVPKGADAVQQVELTREDGSGVVEILEPVSSGRSIVRQASEINAGETVLRAGEQISAAMIATLASFGYAAVRVSRQPRVAVMATGSELVDVNKKPGRDQIRDSNNYTIEAYASQSNAIVERLPLAGDNTEELKRMIREAAETSDVLITSGGVSMGVYDFTKAALKELGAEIFFERVALRPGKPTVFARLGNALVFGLPGNPVSALVTFLLLVRPALLRWQGAREVGLPDHWAVLAEPLANDGQRRHFLRVKVDATGKVYSAGLQASHALLSLAAANGLVDVPPQTTLAAGTVVRVLRW